MSYISVPLPSDSDDGISGDSKRSDRSKLDLSWDRHSANNARFSGRRGKALVVSVCRLLLGLMVLGCGLTMTAQAANQLTASSNYLQFGSVAVGSSSTLPVTLTSTGTSAVTISSASIGGSGYSVSGASFPMTLNPNQSVTLQLRFAPSKGGTWTGTLMLNSNSSTASTTYINTTGKGVVPTTGSLMTISSNYLVFGNVPIGSSSTLPVTLTSTGTSAVTISSASIGGTGYSFSGASFPLTLNPKQAVTLQFKFAPSSAKMLTGTLLLNTNVKTGSAVYINMTGTGVAPGSPQLTVSPSLLPFGSVVIGSSATLPVTLTSTGSTAVTINSVVIGGTGFKVSGATFPLTLNPQQAVALQVTYSPTAANAATGTLTISSNSSTNGTATVSMNGTGTVGPQLTVSPTSLSFGDVNLGSNATLGVTLTSSGGSAVTVNSATINGSGFTLSGATFPVTLSPQQSVSLQVKFAPTAASSSTGTLTINSNSSTNGTVAVSLSGTGASVQHQVSLTWQAPSSSSDPVAGYHVYRATGSSSSYSLVNSSVSAQTSYSDSSVQGSTSYSYYVKSVDASGNESAASNAVSVSVP